MSHSFPCPAENFRKSAIDKHDPFLCISNPCGCEMVERLDHYVMTAEVILFHGSAVIAQGEKQPGA